jgi:hypothetical protein
MTELPEAVWMQMRKLLHSADLKGADETFVDAAGVYENVGVEDVDADMNPDRGTHPDD